MTNDRMANDRIVGRQMRHPGELDGTRSVSAPSVVADDQQVAEADEQAGLEDAWQRS